MNERVVRQTGICKCKVNAGVWLCACALYVCADFSVCVCVCPVCLCVSSADRALSPSAIRLWVLGLSEADSPVTTAPSPVPAPALKASYNRLTRPENPHLISASLGGRDRPAGPSPLLLPSLSLPLRGTNKVLSPLFSLPFR